MISINFNLSNPWSNTFKNLWCRAYKTPIKHKFIELELIRDNSIIYFMFRLSTRTSHGGLNLELGLLGYSFTFNFYDSRHWNYEDGRYFKYSEELGEH